MNLVMQYSVNSPNGPILEKLPQHAGKSHPVSNPPVLRLNYVEAGGSQKSRRQIPFIIPKVVRYRHYENRGKANDFVFATTTCLDFAPILKRSEMKCLVAQQLWNVHKRYRAQLHAYVVMWNHLHIVSKMPEAHDSPWFMQQLKSQISKSLLPALLPSERELLMLQQGLNRRSCWQASFDSLVLVGHHAFHQKIHYIHQNPVRAKLVDQPEDYQWSSAAAYKRGLWTPDHGLDLNSLDTRDVD